MNYKNFGSTPYRVSPICVGTWAMGSGAFWGKTDDDQCVGAIRAMLDQGVNIIDTAPGYNAGRSEEIVGRALKGVRDKVCLVTKAAVYEGPDGSPVHDGGYDSILRQIDGSLGRLGTDYVDVLLMHWPDPKTPLETSMRAFADIKQSGKARFIGISNFTVEQMEYASQFCELSVFQHPYSMVDRTQEDRARWTFTHGMGNMSYGSLGGGILTGAYRTLPNFPEGDARRVFYSCFQEPVFSEVMGLLSIMDEIAAAHHVQPAQVAIAWNIAKEFISTAIIGVKNQEEATANCDGLGWSLAPDELYALDSYIEEHLPIQA